MTWLVAALVVSAAPLSWVERVVGGAKPDDALPLVIAVHGLGDRPERFVRLFDDYPAPLRVVAPAGPTPYHRGYSWFPVQIPVPDADLAMEAGIRASADKLAALARRLAKARPTRGRPVLTGFSQGGVMSFALAARPEVFAATIPVAGSLPRALWPSANARLAPVRALHGEADTVVPTGAARRLVASWRAGGRDVEILTFPGVAHQIPPPVRAALYERIEAATR